jgi:pantoate kinase
MSISAYCPGHISGYFKRVIGNTMATTGSIGAGIVIDPGVTVTVAEADTTTISIRQVTAGGDIRTIADGSPPLESALRHIGMQAAIVTECSLPIGAGFGLSAAALLATLTAVNQLGNRGMDTHEIARIAHETEVMHRTGLGDVAACQGGGRVVRSGAGIDGTIERLFDIAEPIYAVSFGPIPTPTVLGSPEQMERVARAFPPEKPRTSEHFFSLCRTFSENSGLETKDVLAVLRACEAGNVPAGMTMLGNGVFAYGRKAAEVLQPFGNVYRCEMARTGARIVKESL